MSRRVVFISNPRSSNYRKVEKRVLGILKQQPVELVEYKIVHTFFEDNVKRISKVLRSGDLVIAAGGDGTASIVGNGIMASGITDVRLGALGYGNFNDLATALSGRTAKVSDVLDASKTVDFYPIEISVNGKHFRHSFMYADIGLVAGAVDEFEKAPERQRLRHGWSNQFLSFLALVPYYFKHKKHYKLPKSSLGEHKLTDFFAINGERMAKFKIGRGFATVPGQFGVVSLNTSSLVRSLPFTIRSIRGHMPLKIVASDNVEFARPANLDFQSDGEYRKLEGVKTLRFEKSKTPIKVLKLR
ncbi:MAG: hypothetical protein LBL84_00550 [Candidatus Nomurabacteria bacterium]|nr:hypothetical protein [Candidatus Nomurabacteria bacterium]